MEPKTDSVKCSICNSFQGAWEAISQEEVKDTPLAWRNRNHIKLKITWDEFQFSARSCYCCNILVTGCQGSFRQHSVDESLIVHVSIRFYFPLYANEEDAESSKILQFHMKDGSRFEVDMAVAQGEMNPNRSQV